jgi:hypothetical protein
MQPESFKCARSTHLINGIVNLPHSKINHFGLGGFGIAIIDSGT